MRRRSASRRPGCRPPGESQAAISSLRLCSSDVHVGPCEIESRSDSGFRLHPDSTSPALNDPLAQRETNARSWIFRLLMQTFEDYEDLFEIFLSNPDAIVPEGEQPFVSRVPRGHVHLGRKILLLILQRICKQIVKQLRYLPLVA